MKRYTTFFLLCTTYSCNFASEQEVFGRSFMFTRPAYQHVAMQQALFHEIAYKKKGPLYGALQAIGFYQKSSHVPKTTRYFLINRKNDLLVSGDNNIAQKRIRDIRAEWLGLSSNFSGTFSLTPEQKQIGVLWEYNQDLSTLFDFSFFKDSWISISIPFAHVENNLNLEQVISTQSNSDIPDIRTAFRQPSWCFARIDGKQQETNIAEIKAMIGRTLISRDHIQVAYSSSLIIPIANHQNPAFLFDPVVGNDRHVGLSGAVYFQFPLNRKTDSFATTFFINLESTFQVRNEQKRTFDLVNKPFSRYMLYVLKNSEPGQTVPGVNVLTLKTLVRSYGVFDFSTGWRFRTRCFEGEISYNVWGHDSERLKLRRPFDQEFGIAGKDPIIEPQFPDISGTASTSTIDQQAENDKNSNGMAIFVPVKLSDIDLRSAAAGSALNHKIQCSVGTIINNNKIDGSCGFGVYIDIPQKNASLRTWGAWLKISASF